MRGLRLDRVLTGTALALLITDVLAGGNFGAARAENPAQDLKTIEALVPLPDAADIPPPTIADIDRLSKPEPATVGTVPSAPGSDAAAAKPIAPATAAPAAVAEPVAPAEPTMAAPPASAGPEPPATPAPRRRGRRGSRSNQNTNTNSNRNMNNNTGTGNENTTATPTPTPGIHRN